MMRVWVLATTLVCLAGCSAPPPLAVPGARLVVRGAVADVVAAAEVLGQAQLVDVAPLRAVAPALVATAPMVVSVLEGDTLVVSTWVHEDAQALGSAAGSAAPSAAPPRALLGRTVVVKVGNEDVLVRMDRRRALWALHYAPEQELTLAARLEALAEADAPEPAPQPPSGTLTWQLNDGALPLALGSIDGVLRVQPRALELEARALAPSRAVLDALAEPAPPWVCGLERGASLVVRIPPVAGLRGDDAFRGPVVLAAAPAAGGLAIALAGAPASDDAADSLWAPLAEAAGGGARLDKQGRTWLEALGAVRRVQAVRAPGTFAMLVEPRPADGTPGPLALEHLHTSGAPCDPGTLLRAEGPFVARLLAPWLLKTDEALRRLLEGPSLSPSSGAAPSPAGALARISLSAARVEASVHFRGAVEMAAPRP